MKNYCIFLKKEFIESAKTYKLLIMICSFAIIGMMAPLVAKFTPEIVASLLADGIEMNVSTPTATDSWLGFFKNTTQLALTITVIIFSGTLAQEMNRGTLINILTKGMSRSTVVMSKYSMMALTWTICYIFEFLICYGYTEYLFPNEQPPNLIFAAFCLWGFGMFLLAALVFFATIFKASYGALLSVSLFSVMLMLVSLLKITHRFLPVMLVNNNTLLLTNEAAIIDFNLPIIISLFCLIVFVIAGIKIFQRQTI